METDRTTLSAHFLLLRTTFQDAVPQLPPSDSARYNHPHQRFRHNPNRHNRRRPNHRHHNHDPLRTRKSPPIPRRPLRRTPQTVLPPATLPALETPVENPKEEGSLHPRVRMYAVHILTSTTSPKLTTPTSPRTRQKPHPPPLQQPTPRGKRRLPLPKHLRPLHTTAQRWPRRPLLDLRRRSLLRRRVASCVRRVALRRLRRRHPRRG
jgi:hypothetical protein